MATRFPHLLLASAAILVLTACATYRYDTDRYGGYVYDGRAYAEGFYEPSPEDALDGPGVAMLDPWLRHTAEGRRIVITGFRDAGFGFVDEDIAHRANIWFRRYADSDRDMRLTDQEIRIALVQAARGHAF